MIGFTSPFYLFFGSIYMLAMSSTALAVLLGCAVEDPKLATEMLPILFVPQMLFAGFFVVPSLIPFWLRWARYLCTLTYALRILLAAEFWNCDTSDPEANMQCNRLVTMVGADHNDTWWNWIVLATLFAAFRIFALVVLRQKATKFF
jgi:ABC-type multidrug transport system permease subunit